MRRALAEAHGDASLKTWESSFGAIFTAAQKAKQEGLGLERRWSSPGCEPVSITFSLLFSLSRLQLTRLRDDLVRYRLALGQPEPQLFEAMIEHFGLNQWQARDLALNLSPVFSMHHASGSDVETHTITKPGAGSIKLCLDDAEQPADWSVDMTTGLGDTEAHH